MDKVQVRLYRNDDRERWDDYVAGSTAAISYHRACWKDIIEASFKHRTYYLLAQDGCGPVKGILPLVHLKSRFFGSFMVSLPYFNYGGMCADSPDIGDRLCKAAVQLARELKVASLELRHTADLCPGMHTRTSKISMHLELPDSSEELRRSFPSKMRSQIGKPLREGCRTAVGRENLLDDFYTVFSANMRDLGTPVYARHFFVAILNSLPDSSWIVAVYTRDNRPVAAGFLVEFRKTMEIPWASSLRSFNPLSPNMLLYWRALEFACERGCSVFDFGRSTRGEGTYRFKQQWGAKPVQLFWHSWTSDGKEPVPLSPDNPKYRAAIMLWKKLPLPITRLVGPFLVRNLP